MILAVGLHNPGAKYGQTRHNLGGDVVSAFVDRHGAGFRKARRFIRGEVAEVWIAGEKVVLARPRTYMNESGRAVAPLVRYYGVPLERLIVVHDDIDLPFAKLRVQFSRGAGGNKGVASVIRSLGSQEFWRLKCGLGRPRGCTAVTDFVLDRFTVAERDDAALMVQRSVDLLEVFVMSGGEVARQRAGEMYLSE